VISSNASAKLVARAAVSGPRVVTSAVPAAAAAGIAAYARGGNAFDAVLSACFLETIALPMKCGLAGDLVAMFRVKAGPLRALVSVGPGCAAIARGCKLEKLGPRSVGIPGAPDGYSTLAEFATFSVENLIQPAVRAAEKGIVWTEVGLSYVHEAAELLQQQNETTPYMPGGHIPQSGDLLQLPGLGRLLERFAKYRADLFTYSDGERLVSRLQAAGGFLSIEDMQVRPARLVDPAIAEIGTGRLFATPSPTSGMRLLKIVGEALRKESSLLDIVRAERGRENQRGRQTKDDGTSVVTAADSEGNAVVVVHSNSFPRFGSGIVLEDGLVLNNRPGRGFDLTASPDAANAPRAGRVPQTTLHAWALEDQNVLLMGATPGGVNQLPWNSQALMELIGGASIREAVTNPRWAIDDQDNVTVEDGARFPADTSHVKIVPQFSHRSAQQILRIPHTGLLSAAADPRTDAVAIAAY
jgi:gamma-glutamyltranspeptidase / glutathione hydrolase